MKLRFQVLPRVPIDQLDELFAAQLGGGLHAWRLDPTRGELLDRYTVLDESGAHRFDAVLFRGEDGPVYRAGTTDFVACFAQGTATECADDALVDALDEALRALRRAGVTAP